MTRIFVSSIVSGYSILRTLMALLQRTRISQRTTTTKEWKEALRGGKSSQRNGTIHFLRTQDPKLHLQDGISTRSLKHGSRRRELPPPHAAAAPKTAHSRRKDLPLSRMTSSDDATRRTDSLARRRAAMGAGRKASARLRQRPRQQAVLPRAGGEMDKDENDSKVEECCERTNLGAEQRKLPGLRKHPNIAKNSLHERLVKQH